MKKLTLVKSDQRSPAQLAPGFTMIEILVVLMIVGILSTVAAPSWISFVNQRRISVVNDAVFRSLQSAQQEAIKKKLSYSVSFKTENTEPKVAIHITNTIPTNWEGLGKDLELKPGQVLLGTNLGDENTADSAISYNLTTPKTITFDSTGNLPHTANLGNKGLIVVVATPQSGNSTQVLDVTKRCIKVTTLLGAIQIGRKDECDAQ